MTDNEGAGVQRDQEWKGDGERATWPYATILLFGYFGRDSPGGGTLARRTTILLAMIVAASMALSLPALPQWLRLVIGALLPLGALGIGVAYASYLRQLDELSRVLQLEAAALAYVAVLVLMMGIYAYGVAVGGVAVKLDARVLLLLVFVEPVRAAALAWLARRYG